MANPYWAEQYNDAPSEACKDRIVFGWCVWLDFNDDVRQGRMEEYFREREELEARLTLEDWKYLNKYAGHNPWSTKCREMIRKLEQAGK